MLAVGVVGAELSIGLSEFAQHYRGRTMSVKIPKVSVQSCEERGRGAKKDLIVFFPIVFDSLLQVNPRRLLRLAGQELEGVPELVLHVREAAWVAGGFQEQLALKGRGRGRGPPPGREVRSRGVSFPGCVFISAFWYARCPAMTAGPR